MRQLYLKIAVLMMAFWVGLTAGSAQEEEERSRFIQFVENQLSTEDRQIRLNGLQGTLSSNVALESITIADSEGVWLEIKQVQLVWNRSALLRGRLEVESLTATEIDVSRTPVSTNEMPSAEASSFSIPELPVAVLLEELAIDRVILAESVVGIAAELSVAGALSLQGGGLESNFDITRLDGPGGALAWDVGYNPDDEVLAIDVNLSEPEDGLIANAIGLDDRPPVSLDVQGEAPLGSLDVNIDLQVDGRSILAGDVQTNQENDGIRALVDVGGPLSDILPANVRVFFGEGNRLTADALFKEDGALSISSVRVDGGAAQLQASAERMADGFWSKIILDGAVQADAGRIELPGAEGSSVGSAFLNFDYDASQDDAIDGAVTISAFEGEAAQIENVTLNFDGQLLGAQTENRGIRFTTDVQISGLALEDEGLQEALGSKIKADLAGEWHSNVPLVLESLLVRAHSLELRAEGSLDGTAFDGDVFADVADLSKLKKLTGQEFNGQAQINLSGMIDALTGAFDVTVRGDAQTRFESEDVVAALFEGQTRLSGNVKRNKEGTFVRATRLTNNQLDIVADGALSSGDSSVTIKGVLNDLADLTTQADGRAEIDAKLSGEGPSYDVVAKIALPDGQMAELSADDLSISFEGSANAEGTLQGALSSTGTLSGLEVDVSGDIDVDAQQQSVQVFSASIGEAQLAGSIVRNADSGFIYGDVSLQADDIKPLAALALQEASGAADIKINLSGASASGQSATFEGDVQDLQIADAQIGTAEISGSASDILTAPVIDARFTAAQIVAAGVTITSVEGSAARQADDTQFSIDATTFDVSELANAPIAPLDVEAKGTYDGQGNFVELALLTLSNDDSLELRATGRVPASATGTFNLSAEGSVPMTIAEAFLQDRGMAFSGIARFDADISGALSDPQIAGRVSVEEGAIDDPQSGVSINGLDTTAVLDGNLVRIDGLSATVNATQLESASIAPLDVQLSGVFDRSANLINLASLTASNGQQIAVQASGRVPISSTGTLGLTVEGSAPLELAEAFLQNRGTSVSGLARFNASVSGSTSNPQVDGLLSIAGGEVRDPLTNLAITDIGLLAALEGQQVRINRFNGNVGDGGSVSAAGTVGLVADMPADLQLNFNDVPYTDGQTFATSFGGQLNLTGSLVRDPLLGGTINLAATEIAVPETFGAASDLLDVRHVQPDAATQETLNRIAIVSPDPVPNARPSVISLDILVNAPSQIFVRGRGLDAELGGSVRVRGPVTNVQPTGRFEFRRGRLSILSKRIDLDEGSITLVGDLNPFLRFVASTDAGDDITAFITISGRPSDIDVSFSSSPELPQDEIVARIIFGRGVDDLSAVQALQLASAVAELTGGDSPDLVGGLRSAFGLDDLDVVDDGNGGAAVRAGTYINENIYLSVEVGEETETSINLDITDNLTARGTVSTDGETTIGVFFEKDY